MRETFHSFSLIVIVIVVALLLHPLDIEALKMRPIRGNERDDKRISLRVLGDSKDYDKKESIESLEKELYRCLGSFSPFDRFKIPLLKQRLEREEREMKELKEEEEKRLEREERKKKELKEEDEKRKKELKEEEEKRLEREEKSIYCIIEDDYYSDFKSDSMFITRDIFKQWVVDNKVLRKEDSTKIRSFEELEEDGTYVLVKRLLRTNFESYAAFEANIQTRDCVEAIRKGQVLIPPFNESGTITEFEFAISFGKELNTTDLKIKSPVVPDAILIHGRTWLILECKHSFSNRLLKEFDTKCDFIEHYADKKWVHKNYPIPTDVVRVACSVTDFSPVAVQTVSSGMIRIVRDGQAYKIVDN